MPFQSGFDFKQNVQWTSQLFRALGTAMCLWKSCDICCDYPCQSCFHFIAVEPFPITINGAEKTRFWLYCIYSMKVQKLTKVNIKLLHHKQILFHKFTTRSNTMFRDFLVTQILFKVLPQNCPLRFHIICFG